MTQGHTATTHPFESQSDDRGQSPEHRAMQHKEGRIATALERRTARLPSDVFLWAAGASIGGSLVLQMMNRKEDATLVGQWAPTFLSLGIYNKMVKLLGHDYAR